jgi:hydroxymethylpyrimidine/phosphomethylpyrimidine kinase
MATDRSAPSGVEPPTPVALTVAGSDPSGGAGIQADLKTFHAFGVYGAAVVTALTVQNTREVRAVHSVAPEVVIAQLDAVTDDLRVSAAKIGLVPDPDVAAALATRLARRPLPQLVLDPVLVAGSGDALSTEGTAAALRALLPHVTLVTPNLSEAAALTGRRVDDLDAMADAARALVALGAAAALVKGGHLPDRPVDVLATGGTVHRLDGPRVRVAATHGAGCTLSAAIVAGLAAGRDLVAAVASAKKFVHDALAAAPVLGGGARPLDHRVRPAG